MKSSLIKCISYLIYNHVNKFLEKIDNSTLDELKISWAIIFDSK